MDFFTLTQKIVIFGIIDRETKGTWEEGEYKRHRKNFPTFLYT